MRRLLVGKEVRYLIQYSTANGRDFGVVQIQDAYDDETDLSTILIKTGLATVRRSEKKQQSEENDLLELLETEAHAQGRGLHVQSNEKLAISVHAPVQDMNAFLQQYAKKEIPATIEQVRDGSTYRVCLYLGDIRQHVTFSLSGVKAPVHRKDIPNVPDQVPLNNY